MRGVNHNHIDTGGNKLLDALFRAIANTDRSAYAKLPMTILARRGMFSVLNDILDSRQATQLEGVVHDQNALKTMLMHQSLSLCKGGTFFHRD